MINGLINDYNKITLALGSSLIFLNILLIILFMKYKKLKIQMIFSQFSGLIFKIIFFEYIIDNK